MFLCIFDSISGSDNLLMGKLISQGASKSEVVGAARLEGGSDSQIEEVKVTTLCRTNTKINLSDF